MASAVVAAAAETLQGDLASHTYEIVARGSTFIGPAKIKALRLRENTSQNVFAAYLNVAPGPVSKWECGEKRPQGATLKLLSLIDKNGLAFVA